MIFEVGGKFEFLVYHQSYRNFVPRVTVGEITEVDPNRLHWLRARVFNTWTDSGRYTSEWLRASDTFWLERIGYPHNPDGSHNMPHMCRVERVLSEVEFQRRCSELGA
jgi:hypothetical protein